MLDTLGTGDTLSVQESPPDSNGISPQTKRLDYIGTPIDTSIHIYLEWPRRFFRRIICRRQALWIRDGR